MRGLKIFLVTIVVIYGVMVVGWQFYVQKHRLSFVPSEMQVFNVLYAEEAAWGFGPGGNETGFIMYELPADIAEKVRGKGIAYLSSFPSAQLGMPDGRQGKYQEWFETPIEPKKRIPLGAREGDPECGFCIDVKEEFLKIFKTAINASGSYYAYGRTGMILVVPSEQKVFFIYEG